MRLCVISTSKPNVFSVNDAALPLRCAPPRYRQASLVRHLAVESDLQPLRVGDLRKADAAGRGVAGQGETVAKAGGAGGGVDDAGGGGVGVGGESDGAEEANVVGRGGVCVGRLGEAVEAEDVDLAGARAGHGRAGGEDGLELAGVAAGGDVVEAHEGVAPREGVARGRVQGDGDLHAVRVGRRVGLVDQVDEGREDGGAGARDQVGGTGWLGGGEEGGGQDGECDGEGVHLGGGEGVVVLVLFCFGGGF